MSVKDPSNFTVNQLKEKLREIGLSSMGNKAELINRLIEADPLGEIIETVSEMPEASAIQENQSEFDVRTPIMASHYEREIEMYRREKELAERELQLARRELELVRERQLYSPERSQARRENDVPRASIAAIADLLGCFDGSVGDYKIWEEQLKLLKTTYRLTDECIKVLIGMRLKGKAAEWLHSKPEHIGLPIDDLLDKLREMYDHRPSRILLRKRFEERNWKREETFHEYVHDKVILANQVPISEDEIIDYIIDGIPVANLRDQARIGTFTSKASLLQAFEKVTLRDRLPASGAKKGDQPKRGDETQRQRGGEKKDAKKSENEKRCFNCGLRNHVSVDCPTKAEGPKCFQCGERGHIASKCGKSQKAVRTAHIVTSTERKKYTKEVELNGSRVLALVDTGSDLCLLRSDKYIKLGSPKLNPREIRFRGIGSSNNSTLGEFNANLAVDGNTYPILVRVVSDTLLNHELIIGADFLNTIEMTIKAGEIAIRELPRPACDNENVPEIFQIDLDSEGNDEIDISHVSEIEYKNQIKDLVAGYSPNKSREIDMKMTIVVKDEEPVYQRARRLPASEREKVNAQISEWVRDGIVQPSLSEYASIFVLPL